MTGYDEAAQERWAPEQPKRSGRSPFERDRARVLHSAGLRRLAAKTQVVVPWQDDFVRNRLTHSLEVAQVGRELGRVLGCDPDVVDTACLAHDLGHPPFGHNGEVALDVVAAACGGFEGNAQTLRLLTRLEAKAEHPGGASAGLNLTRASLDAACKYPWTREQAPPRRTDPRGGGADGVLVGEPAPPKFGVYADDRPVFGWLRSGAVEGRRCIETQVMDFADDVAYCVHDVEDGIQAGSVDVALLASDEGRAAVADVAVSVYAPDTSAVDAVAALDRLTALPFWPRGYDGGRRDLAALKNATSQLIGRFASAAEGATRAQAGPAPLQRYAADLVVPRETALEVAVLKSVAAHYVMRAQARVSMLAHQRDLLAELVAALADRAPDALEPPFRADWQQAADDAARLRVVVDQVASLTDPSAVTLHARLVLDR